MYQLASPPEFRCALYSCLLGAKQEATPWGGNLMGLMLRLTDSVIAQENPEKEMPSD